MVVVEVLTKDLSKETKLTDVQIIDALTKLGVPATQTEGMLVVELTPNRPDLFFISGLARALCGYCNGEIKKYVVKKGEYRVIVDKSVEKIRPYTVCAVVKNLNLDQKNIDALIRAQEKLMMTIGRKTKRFGMGFFDLKKLIFPIRYTTRVPEEIVYKPLNYPTMANAKEILERHPKGIENGYLIKNFDRYPLFLDGNGKIMVLIPIVNSEEVGKIDAHTNELFIEVTGVDLDLVTQILNLTVCSLIDMGGVAYSVEMRYHDKKFRSLDLKEDRMKMDIEFLNKILGLKLGKKEVSTLLGRMGYVVRGDFVVIPPYRLDIIHFIDIVEDVAIAYGYENIEPEIPQIYSEGNLADYQKLELANLMYSMGFLEVKTLVLANEKKLGMFELVGEKTENPASSECEVVKPSLVSSMVEIFVVNKMAGLPQKLFEIGVVYNVLAKKQEKRLVFGIVEEKIDFSTAKGYLQTLLKEFGVRYSIEKIESDGFDEERCCGVLINNRKQGVFGLLSNKIRESFDLKNDVYLCELVLPFEAV